MPSDFHRHPHTHRIHTQTPIKIIIKKKSWAWWYVSVILTFGRLRQEDCFEIKASQGYIAKACFKINNRKRKPNS